MGGYFFTGHTGHCEGSSKGERDASTAVGELHKARAGRCAQIIEQAGVAGHAKAHDQRSIEAGYAGVVESAGLERDNVSAAVGLRQNEPRRRAQGVL